MHDLSIRDTIETHLEIMHTVSVFGVDFRLILAAVTFPICAAKQIISVIQFMNASKSLARMDIEDRIAKRAPKNE